MKFATKNDPKPNFQKLNKFEKKLGLIQKLEKIFLKIVSTNTSCQQNEVLKNWTTFRGASMRLKIFRAPFKVKK